MCWSARRDRLENGTEADISAEQQNRRLRVAPSGVRQQLVDRLQIFFLTVPKLTLRDENVFVFLPNQDVRFAFRVESLARGLPFVLPVQLHQELSAKVFFAHLFKSLRTPLHHENHIPHDIENVLVLFEIQGRLELDLVGRSW